MHWEKHHRPTFTYTDFPCYVSQTFNVIKRSGLVVWGIIYAAVLNSRVVAFSLKYRGKLQGSRYQINTGRFSHSDRPTTC